MGGDRDVYFVPHCELPSCRQDQNGTPREPQHPHDPSGPNPAAAPDNPHSGGDEAQAAQGPLFFHRVEILKNLIE